MAKTQTFIKNFLSKHRYEFYFAVVIALFSLFLRLWRIDAYLTFLGDEGRDVRIVRDLLAGNLVFIGPMTSVGNMYLGPLYYYLIAPALWLSRLDPVGPAVMIALLSGLTTFLIWLIGRSWFGRGTALLASFFFAISPVAIIYGRSSWNPNPMPLFALLTIYFLDKARTNSKFLPVSVGFFAATLQFHYLGFLLLPVIGLYSLYLIRASFLTGKQMAFFKMIALSLVVFAVSLAPLILFDLKHDGLNSKSFIQFFTDRQTTINLNPGRSDRFLPVVTQIVTDMYLSRQTFYAPFIAIISAVFFFVVSFQKRGKPAYQLLALWLGFGVLGLSVYKQHVYAHYYGFMYPALYYLLAILIRNLWQLPKFLKVFSLLVLIAFTYLAVAFSPLKQSPNYQLARTKLAAKQIIDNSKGQPFNFGLIAKQNYDESYRYFLENAKAPLVRSEDRLTDQLFVVCEDGQTCQPLGNSGYQIAKFGIAKLDYEWQIDHLRLYRIIHQP